MRFKLKVYKEFLIGKLICMSAISTIIILILIFLFLFKEGLPALQGNNFSRFFFGKGWHPTSEPAEFGLLPLLAGSALVTFGALIIGVPLAVACAAYLAEVAPSRVRELLKPIIELIAAIPSVVLGFIGLIVLSDWIKSIFNLSTGLSALTGSITLAFMALPTMASIAEDAIVAVPREYKEAALALGATRWQTLRHVLLPAARSGIVAAVMLGIGRAIGETMAVLMVTGNAAVIPRTFLEPVRTMTATIAMEMGEVVQGGAHYQALFATGITLFALTFLINLLADLALQR